MTADAAIRGLGAALQGRPFVHPAFDYLLIGGGLSVLATALVAGNAGAAVDITSETLPILLLLSNAAHFAASTVRLYTKPGSRESLPFLTMGFPLLALVALTVSIALAEQIGPHLQSLYLTWSPYHYAAQAYGLAVLYSFRSGCRLQPQDKRLLWWVAMLPFFYNFATTPGVGLHWLLPESVLGSPLAGDALRVAHGSLVALALTTPLLLFAKVWRSPSGPMPLISLLTVVTNGIWFFVLAPLDAFVYATIFHGLQYLAIVIVFHVRDRMGQPENHHGTLYHVLWFYGVCLLMGYTLFYVLPLAYVFFGFGRVESLLLVAAAINIHHFVVDAYIWRLRRTDGNYRIMAGAVPARA
jgi:hypothetical protein